MSKDLTVKIIDVYEFSRDVALLEQRNLFEKYKISYPLPTEDEVLKILTEEGLLNRLIDEVTSSDAAIVLIRKKTLCGFYVCSGRC